MKFIEQVSVFLITQRFDGRRVDDSLLILQRHCDGVPARQESSKRTSVQQTLETFKTPVRLNKGLPLQQQFFLLTCELRLGQNASFLNKAQPAVEMDLAQKDIL